MHVSNTNESSTKIDADAVVIGVAKDVPLEGAALEIDLVSGGLITRMIELGEIGTSEMSTTRLLGVAGAQAPIVQVVGLGPNPKRAGMAFKFAGTASKALASKHRNRVAFYLDLNPVDELVAGAMVGCVGQDLFRTEKKLIQFDELLVSGGDQKTIARGVILGESINVARRLVNLPASEIYPESFADEAGKMAKAFGLEIKIWDQRRLEQEQCGALLAVARGSDKESRMVIVRHAGGGQAQPWTALVGKGVTFDSGGLSLKPSDSMVDMKCDMAGAATVLASMAAIARLKLPVNVMGLMGLAENMVSGASFKLGDVLRARSGKTIEVLNTDAEGRLVLADVLDVAIERGANRIVDLATLTGACVVALGRHVVGGMTNDQVWYDQVASAASRTGESLWQLPMFPEYAEQIKSSVADIKNIGDGRWGGAITAAKFLQEFVKDVPWVHLDIAGPSFLEKPLPHLDGGGSGCFVRTLVELADAAR